MPTASRCKMKTKSNLLFGIMLLAVLVLPHYALAADNSTLIMYYSMSGKTRIVAEELKALMPSADLIEIKSDVGIPTAIFWHLIFDQNATIEPLQVDPERYSKIILCSPVWMQRISSPAKTVINTVQMQGKQMEVFVTCAGHFGEGGQNSVKELLSSKGIKLTGLHIIKTGDQPETGIRNQVREEAKNLCPALKKQPVPVK